jgi:hypothetical protein
VGEVALGVESLGDGLMVGELLAVVIGERVNKVGMRLQCCEQDVRDGLCGLVGSLSNDAVACLASNSNFSVKSNLSFASFCSIYGVMGTRAPCKTTPLISGLVG